MPPSVERKDLLTTQTGYSPNRNPSRAAARRNSAFSPWSVDESCWRSRPLAPPLDTPRESDPRGRRPGAQSIGAGRLACPALERPREAALFGEARQEGDFGKTIVRFSEQPLCKIPSRTIDQALKRMPLFREPPLQRASTHRKLGGDGRHRGHPFTEYSGNGAPYPMFEVTLLCQRRQLLLEMAIKESNDRLVTEPIWRIETRVTDQEGIAPGFKVNRTAEMGFIH